MLAVDTDRYARCLAGAFSALTAVMSRGRGARRRRLALCAVLAGPRAGCIEPEARARRAGLRATAAPSPRLFFGSCRHGVLSGANSSLCRDRSAGPFVGDKRI